MNSKIGHGHTLFDRIMVSFGHAFCLSERCRLYFSCCSRILPIREKGTALGPHACCLCQYLYCEQQYGKSINMNEMV